MRYPVPGNKTVFMRFHEELDSLIEEEAKKRNMKKATLVAEAFTAYTLSPFHLLSSSHFFLKRGRGREKKIGKGMNVTVKETVINEIRIRGEEEGIRESDFRASVIYSYIKN